MSQLFVNRLFAQIVAAFCLGAVAQAAVAPLTGAGSTFSEPLYKKWGELANQANGTSVTYDGVGSGEGIARIEAKKVDFGASDEPLSRDALATKNLRQFPTCVGAIVVAVNLPGVPKGKLKLSAEALADIYLGKVTRWNDPEIAASNEPAEVKLPNLPIKPVSRAESSGSTFVMAYFLSARVPAWQKGPGVAKLLKGVVGQTAEGTGGIVNYIKQTPGAIGYMDFGRATRDGLNMVQLPNRVGIFVEPTVESIEAAMKSDAESLMYNNDPDFYLILSNNETYKGWPMATATFVLLPKSGKDVRRILDFYYWAFQNGDKAARDLGYVPLSETMKLGVRKAWSHQYGYKAGF
ncbi:MAG: phosphate ABC transporter substrate-binding protein PstS [Burkholderiales bacterium]|nr:phosphate ABC transporter substrate-binding protein PstS [Burkholderiales bacterium]